MKGAYTKRKLKKFWKKAKEYAFDFCYEIKRFFVKRSIKIRNFTIISNNCWAGRVYQYLDMPYLSPTVGLYFFAPDYIKFVSNLKYYLDTPLEFIKAEDSKYFDELKEKNQLDKPIGVLDDVEIVFLHYKSQEEALEKWNRRKNRVNFDDVFFKFSWSNLSENAHLEYFDNFSFRNKFIFVDKSRKGVYKSGVFWSGKTTPKGIVGDTEPFPGNISLRKLLNRQAEKYPPEGLKNQE